MRQPFDIMASVYTGPDGDPPDTFIKEIPARLVLQDHVIAETPDLLSVVGYLTCSITSINAPSYSGTVGTFEINLWAADVIEAPSGLGNFWAVLKREVIIPAPGQGSPYMRLWLSDF